MNQTGKISHLILLSRKYLPLFLILFFAVGVAGTMIPVTSELFRRLFPLALLLSMAALMIFTEPSPSPALLGTLAAIAIAGFLIEVIGVKSGIIFGNYSYGSSLGPKLFNTPLIIGINWAMLVFAAHSITGRLEIRPVIRILLAAILMVLYDVLLELITSDLGMWYWENGLIPLQNFIGWFAVSVIFLTAFSYVKPVYRSNIAWLILTCHALFFALLILFFKILR
jgi:putative membrane protein